MLYFYVTEGVRYTFCETRKQKNKDISDYGKETKSTTAAVMAQLEHILLGYAPVADYQLVRLP